MVGAVFAAAVGVKPEGLIASNCWSEAMTRVPSVEDFWGNQRKYVRTRDKRPRSKKT